MYKIVSIAAVLFASSASTYAQGLKGDESKPISKPPVASVDFDRFYADPCYLSNCESVPAARSAQAVSTVSRSARGSDVVVFKTFSPSYVAPASCTSLLSSADNAFQTVLDSGVQTPGSNRLVNITFNAEGRIQRQNASTDNGVGAIGVRLLLEVTPPSGAPVQTELFARWVLHSAVDFGLITDGPNPMGVNQPIINSIAVNRLIDVAPGSTYRLTAQVKWSDAFTGLPLEQSPISFVADGGGRGAIVCVPSLSIVESSAL